MLKASRSWWRFWLVCGWLLTSPLLDGASSAEPTKKHILLLAQKPDGHPPLTHEYQPGLKLLAEMLARQPGIKTTITSADEPWSEGIELLRKADGAVMFLSQGAAWTSADVRRLDALSTLAARRGGLVTIHWGMGSKEAANIEPYLKLFGGCHGGPDRKFKVVDTRVELAAPAHVIAAGIKPFDVHEEFYYKLKFAKSGEPVQPVVTVEIDGERETVAWAWQRPDGGRSFGFSGLHYHANWRHVEYRRLIVQAVLWANGLAVPGQGVSDDSLVISEKGLTP